MGWENVITGYRLVKMKIDSIIPLDYIYLDNYIHTNFYDASEKTHYFIFKAPIYIKKNVKQKK